MSAGLQLAITTIGDLLLDTTISQNSEGKPISQVHLKIPPYQRPYKWNTKNAIQLLDDIIEAKNQNKETYRVGTLILHHDAEKGLYNVVDGQQRTITFSLLLMAINEEKSKAISFLNQCLTDDTHNARNIPNNYRTLERRIHTISDSRERIELYEYIKNNCELIVVITNDISEAFQFFDSQNARGKKLYPHDLLKAYHLREMNNLDITQTEKTVKDWEDLDQKKLSLLFSDYLYRVKEWVKGNRAEELNENNIQNFKGINRTGNYPYAQFFKGAYAYADMVNQSAMPFVSGMNGLKSFQIDTPIIAGKSFFDYAKHYFEILKDIQNNNKYEGYFINDNDIVKTLDLRHYKNGVGNGITRLLFDTAILLYVDRFCPSDRPSKADKEMLEKQFVLYAFIWAYSLRAQYDSLGWQSAQNYILGNNDKKQSSAKKKNSYNIYKMITEADSPVALLSILSDKLSPLSMEKDILANTNDIDIKVNGVYQNYLYYFKLNKFVEK